MAITNWNNFMAVPNDKSPFDDLLENVLKGYKIGREPAKMNQEEEQRTLANSLKQLELKQKPEQFELEKRYKEALINKANTLSQNKGSIIKPNGPVANIAWVNEQLTRGDITPEYRAQLQEAIKNQQEHVASGTQRNQTLNSSAAARAMPAAEKKWALAMGRGMGLDPTAMQMMLNQGKTVSDIAKDLNIPLEEVKPKYAPGEELVKQNQKRQAFTDELDSLAGNTNEFSAKYRNLMFGYSIEQMADAVKGENPETQGKVLAARALQPEINALRLKMANASIGIEALREMEQKSLSNLKIIEGLVDTETYSAMQKYMNEWLREASDAFGKSIDDNGLITPWGQDKPAKSEMGQAAVIKNNAKTFDFSKHPVAGSK